MKILFVIIIFSISFSASSSMFDSCKNENSKWFACEKNEDCVVISNPCGHPIAAANKQFSKEAEKCNIQKGAVISCPSWSGVGGESIHSFCKNKVCNTTKRWRIKPHRSLASLGASMDYIYNLDFQKKWPAGERFIPHRHWGGEEIFVLTGEFIDEHARYPAGTWMRSPHLSAHCPYVEQETIIFVKTGHLGLK